MSGGHFNYDQHKIGYIVESINFLIEGNSPPVDTRGEVNEFYYNYSDEIIDKFKEAVVILRKAQIYAQRIDYLVSGDDGEESFLKRLQKDLEQLNK